MRRPRPLSRRREGDRQASRRAVRPRLDLPGRPRDPLPPVPRHRRLGGSAFPLDIPAARAGLLTCHGRCCHSPVTTRGHRLCPRCLRQPSGMADVKGRTGRCNRRRALYMRKGIVFALTVVVDRQRRRRVRCGGAVERGRGGRRRPVVQVGADSAGRSVHGTGGLGGDRPAELGTAVHPVLERGQADPGCAERFQADQARDADRGRHAARRAARRDRCRSAAFQQGRACRQRLLREPGERGGRPDPPARRRAVRVRLGHAREPD